jgi:hypothetical protein
MEQEQTTVQPTAPKETSTISKLMNIFVAPGEVFESIKAAPKKSALWVLPTVTAAIISVLSVFVVMSDPAIQSQLRDAQEKRLQKMIDEGTIPPERVEAARQQMTGMIEGPVGKIFGSVSAVIFLFASLLVVSLAMLLVGKFAFKTAVPYGKVMEVIGPSFMITYVLGGIVTTLIMLAMGSLYATPGLALAISEFDPMNKVHALLGSINIFTLWYLGVLSIGVGRLFSVKTAKAAVWVVGLWVVWTLLTVFFLTFLRMG